MQSKVPRGVKGGSKVIIVVATELEIGAEELKTKRRWEARRWTLRRQRWALRCK